MTTIRMDVTYFTLHHRTTRTSHYVEGVVGHCWLPHPKVDEGTRQLGRMCVHMAGEQLPSLPAFNCHVWTARIKADRSNLHHNTMLIVNLKKL